MNIEDAMHPKADWASADMPVSEVARMMATDDIGARRDPDRTLAEQVMSPGIGFCTTHETLEDAIHLMDQKKIRRLPVLDGNKRMIGMLGIGDIAHAVGQSLAGELLRAVAAHHR